MAAKAIKHKKAQEVRAWREVTADAVGLSQREVATVIGDLAVLEALPKLLNLAALYQDDFEPELPFPTRVGATRRRNPA